MKIKLLIVFVSALFLFHSNAFSQGLYSKKAESEKTQDSENNSGDSSMSFFQSDNSLRSGRPDKPGGPGEPIPVKEGVLFLCLMAGLYGVKRVRDLKKAENK